MAHLQISDSLRLPLDVVGEATAIIGKRNSGKTYTAKVFVEEMLRNKQHVIVVEPTDVWYGLRSPASGKGAGGYPVAVFGGSHADLPLEPGHGKYMADLLMGERLSAVLCLKLFSKTARHTFMADFAERLLQIVQENVHVVLEEAHEWVPQRSSGTTARMLGACSDLTTTGRTMGIGTTLVSQRPARLHKDPYEQTDNLVVHRLVGTNDRKAAEGWVKAQELSAEAAEMLNSLPVLKQGTAWVYAPALLGEPREIQVRALQTFDSSATPKPGQSRREPKTVADINLSSVRAAMVETIERAKADDPRELRKRIAELEHSLAREIEGATSYESTVQHLEQQVETLQEQVRSRPALDDGLVAELTVALENVRHHSDTVAQAVEDHAAAASKVETYAEKVLAALQPPEPAPANVATVMPLRERAKVERARSASITQAVAAKVEAEGGEFRIGGPEQRVLDALAWLEKMSLRPAKRIQVAMIASYHERTKALTNALGALRTNGYVDYPLPGWVELTDLGRQTANWPAGMGTTAELQAKVFEQVKGTRERILRQVLEHYPQSVSRGVLAHELGYHERTKAYTNGLGALRTLGLIEYPAAGIVRATDVLFV